MKEKISREVEVVARAIERRYHEGGVRCHREDGWPRTCWRSNIGMAKAVIAALRSSRRPRKTAKKEGA